MRYHLKCGAIVNAANSGMTEKDWGLPDALELYGRSQLYQKAGYILEALKNDLSLPEPFFAECEK